MSNKIFIVLTMVFVIGMCMNNGYYVESDSDWNTDMYAKIQWYTPQQIKDLYTTTSSLRNINIYK